MQLSRNFYLSELVVSQSATRLGIHNEPNAIQVQNLKILCQKVLQPVRDIFQKPVVISSGYRSPLLNSKIGGNKSSQHCLGRAADFTIPGLLNKDVATWIRKNLDYDQLILEYYDSRNPQVGWIHCSYGTVQRKQALTFNGGPYLTWV
jgi:zinc D-Ala-D-Ala carboxypeptidase